jgi:hypothetical protein
MGKMDSACSSNPTVVLHAAFFASYVAICSAIASSGVIVSTAAATSATGMATDA